MNERLVAVGWIAGLGCLALLISEAHFNQAPPLASMNAELHVVDATPFLERPPKGATYGVLPAASVRFVIPNVCNKNACALPPAISNLKPGETIRIWRDALKVWQLEAINGGSYTYRQAVAESEAAKANAYLWYLAGLLVGVVLVVWGHAKSAP